MAQILTKAEIEEAPAKTARPRLSPLNQRRWQNFKANRRGYWSLWIFLLLFVLSLAAELIANDKPVIASYKGEILFPVLVDYPEEKFGGFYAVTDYRDPVIQDEIKANGWLIWPPVRYSYRTVNDDIPEAAPGQAVMAATPGAALPAATRSASTTPTARSATGTGWAPTTRRATCSPASSTAFASRCCSA